MKKKRDIEIEGQGDRETLFLSASLSLHLCGFVALWL
jgi:hypothetical protein